jgi:hypothetical protein
MVANGFDGVPLPRVSLPPLAVVATNTPNCEDRMHGSFAFDGSSAFDSHVVLLPQAWNPLLHATVHAVPVQAATPLPLVGAGHGDAVQLPQ